MKTTTTIKSVEKSSIAIGIFDASREKVHDIFKVKPQMILNTSYVARRPLGLFWTVKLRKNRFSQTYNNIVWSLQAM